MNRFLAFIALIAGLALPAAVLAQASAQNTLPAGIYYPNGATQVQTLPIGIVTKDSVSGQWCIIGASATCSLPALDAAQLAALADLNTTMSASVSFLPPIAPVASSDSSLTAAVVNFSGSGDQLLVSATASQLTRVHILTCSFASGTAVNVYFKAGSTAITHLIPIPATGGNINWSYSYYPWLRTAANEALNVNLSQAVAGGCTLKYVKGA